jgi:CheY-like chemotaxis protein
MVLTSAKGILALLAGRKLLLADDSVTIQKVIDLTFADEGVQVIAFGNGREAIDSIEEAAPDVVLADVFMPLMNGYEVCEYIKQNEKLKHIPVMLLVGSFEPFDEAEARRVGADDILTKPFQSIRRLIDKVGALVSSRPVGAETPTSELPKTDAKPIPEEKPAAEERLNTQELEITTADTLPLPEEAESTPEPITPEPMEEKILATEANTEDAEMNFAAKEPRYETLSESDDGLLDLGEFEPVQAVAVDDFVFELDLDEPVAVESPIPEPAAYQTTPLPPFVEPHVSETMTGANSSPEFAYQPQIQNHIASTYVPAGEIPYEDQVHEVAYAETIEVHEVLVESPPAVVETRTAEHSSTARQLTIGDLSPELIDAIARRAVEMLSESVVQEIAWEVVPDLAELLIKRQLEEKESQPK